MLPEVMLSLKEKNSAHRFFSTPRLHVLIWSSNLYSQAEDPTVTALETSDFHCHE